MNFQKKKKLNTVVEVFALSRRMIRHPDHQLLASFFCPVEKPGCTLHRRRDFNPAGSSWSEAGWCAHWEGVVYFLFLECLKKAPLRHTLKQAPVAGRKNTSLPLPGSGQLGKGWPLDFSCLPGIPGTAVEPTVCNSPRRPPLCGLSRR